jgi:tetratricopeptide (TPR) repeat protein
VHNLLGYYCYRSPGDSFPRAKAAIQRALEIDPNLGEAHTSLAYAVHYYDWEWESAEREYKRGIELNPSNAQAYLWHLNFLAARQQWDQALANGARGAELDPLAGVMTAAPGWVRYFKRDYEGSLEMYRKSFEIDRGFGPGHLWCSWPYMELQRFDDALREIETARAIMGDALMVQLAEAHTHARAGNRDAARQALDRALRQRDQRYVPAYLVAIVLSALGDREPAWEWLERAVAERGHWLVFLDVDPRFDGFREDPRFAEIRRRVGV